MERRLLSVIWRKVKSSTEDIQAYRDLRDTAQEVLKTDVELGLHYLSLLSDRIGKVITEIEDVEKMRELYGLHRSVLKAGARDSFDMYLLFVEFNREPSKKFYLASARCVETVGDDLQDLADGRLTSWGLAYPSGRKIVLVHFLHDLDHGETAQ